MSTRSVDLYLYPGASSLATHILFQYANVPFMPRLANPTDQETSALNPKQQVPFLVLDGHVVTENPAIAHAVNQLAPDKAIMGRNDMEFLKVCEWLNWFASSFQAQAWSPWIRPWRFTTDKAGEAAVRTACEQKLLERFDMLESMLDANGPWALGEHFTAVDAFVFHWGRAVKSRMGVKLDMKYLRWARVFERVNELEAVRKALSIEDEMRAYAKPFS